MNLHPVERVEWMACAAVRCVDAATDLPVRDGLSCELRRTTNGDLLARSVATPSGLHHWPTLGPRWQCAPSRPDAVGHAELWIVDLLDRFLPLRSTWSLSSADITEITLSSAPARPTPAGAATLHAWLADASGKAAAWARVVATGEGGRQVTGMSDGLGRLTLHLPFPRPDRRAAASVASPAVPSATVSASVGLTFQHGEAVAAETAGRGAPRLDLWLSQPASAALAHVDGRRLSSTEVIAGLPQVLRTQDLSPDRSQLRLVPL